MLIVNKIKGKFFSLPAKEIKDFKSINSNLSRRILEELAKKPNYPKELSNILKVNEQKIYYHVRKLEKSRIIEITKIENMGGAQANFYSLIKPALVIKFKKFEESQKIIESNEAYKKFLEPFIEEGEINAKIIVGSPDPHGPEKARSRDGYYGIDFALFLGTFINHLKTVNVKLDTETKSEDLKENMILIGGPVINTITEKINERLPIKFEKEDNWGIYSSLSNKTYHADETGIIVKIKNPFNNKKSILLIAGKRFMGTKAAILALIKKFDEIIKGNKYDNKIIAKVIEGIDLDSDGIVDDIEILE